MDKTENSAHGFTEGSEFKTETKGKKHRPDFPEWIKSKEGEDCLKWPISEVKYLHNRLFWAFDAGRNCVWDQYIAQKAELSKAKELNGELVDALDSALIDDDGWRKKAKSLIKKI